MKRPSAEHLYYGLAFLGGMPTWVVMAVYLVRDLHLTPLQLVLMGTAMEAAVFLFEMLDNSILRSSAIPTGASCSRR